MMSSLNMDLEEKLVEKLKSGSYTLIPTWERYLRLVSALGVVYLIFYLGAWSKNAEVSFHNHQSNKDIHMPLMDAQTEFITRREYNITLKNIEATLNELNKKTN